MFDYSNLYPLLQSLGMQDWAESLPGQVDNYFSKLKHGTFKSWQQAIMDLPKLTPGSYDFNNKVIRIGEPIDANPHQQQQIKDSFKQLMPWRKGPFEIFGVEIDTEWRSDMKWQRLESAISFNNKSVLDIGSGNGYYSLRMLGQGAHSVIGVDPTLLFCMQYEAIKKYLPEIPAYILPFGIQDLPVVTLSFDIVFSMGVIYHRRDPAQHVEQLAQCLKPGGELIMESLIVDDKYGECLIPNESYAKMKNVWWIPSTKTLIHLLQDNGFATVKAIDESVTTVDEQRVTEWMQFESLINFLDPKDKSKTIEGYPAPKRAILHAIKA